MTMLKLDHLAIVAPTLAEGVAHARACLGLDMPEGGRHPQMGTRNHLLRLGDDVFLEVIAVDEEAPAPARRRWFGLDAADTVRADWEAGRRLRGWVARTDGLDGTLAAHPGLFGEAARLTRGELAWRFALRDDGAWPEDGLAPCVMDWGPRGNPAPAMPDLGARLDRFVVEHPEPAVVAALHAALALRDPPAIEPGPAFRYRATIRTPAGLRTLF